MEVLVLLIAASLALAGGFLAVFFWATRTGQFDDTTTPAMRILTDDPPARSPAVPIPLHESPIPSSLSRHAGEGRGEGSAIRSEIP